MTYSNRLAAPEAVDCAYSERDEAGLRATLRHVPILPAPAVLEDLLERIEPRKVWSGLFGEIISDARTADAAPAREDQSSYRMPPPLSYAANTNVRPAERRRRSALASLIPAALLNAAIILATILIAWNALRTPDAMPSRFAASALNRPDVAQPHVEAATEAASSDRIDETLSGPDASKSLVSGKDLPGVTAQALGPAGETPNSAEAAGSAEPAMLEPGAPEPALRAKAVEPIGALASAEPTQVADPEAHTGSLMESPPVAVAVRIPEANETLASAAVIELPRPELPLPLQLALVGPEPTLAASLARDTPSKVAVATAAIRPKARAKAPFLGVWGETVQACTPAGREEGSLLAYISARSGRAGDTRCAFGRTKRIGNAWHIAATCSDQETSWKSDVRLSVRGRRLTWSSQKGSTTYVKCGR